MNDSLAPCFTLREPRPEDAPAVWRLVRDSEILDTNSAYYYNLWFRDFAGTSVVAVDETGCLVGFVTAYVRPDEPEILMAWQSAVNPEVNAPGLAVRMMHHLADRAAQHGVTGMETTINPGNRAVALMLRKFARERGLHVHTETLFATEDFPADEAHVHPPEVLYRMTPQHDDTAPAAAPALTAAGPR
ncbi:diaminobutyrate acetyltransferase [Streptomyces sp. ODS05-4]|uniref:diaminobutyrate acetyltransferase n=1 Tax=Streptomyces sp. ODS05-4 TaxID=2944939 RepID=UPI00210A694B|nr:diaminobutyrate acetyltransferase [Streptomyces sp. ODS05-4]